MKFLIISDTHGRIDRAARLIDALRPQIDGVWHLGDNYRDFELLEKRFALPLKLAFQAVPGNCDPACPAPERRLIPVEGHQVFMCHGHMYAVSGGNIGVLDMVAPSSGADVVLFGHTHVPLLQTKNGILSLNPGSLSLPRGGSDPSYAILELASGQPARAEIFSYQQE